MSRYSQDNSDFSLPAASGSHLLSESPLVLLSDSSYLHEGTADDDLSLSELSIIDRPPLFSKPFSLLAKPEAEPTTPVKPPDDDGNAVHEEGNETAAPGDMAEGEEEEEEEDQKVKRQSDEKQREEKLQSDLFVLKKLNAAFASFHEALEDTDSASQRVAAQLKQTDALLNKYIDMLSKSEDFSRLILDEQFQGAEADEELLEQERKEAAEKARREAEERALAERRERERREREEQERLEREEKERIERERQERLAARGGVRGVRGTRASHTSFNGGIAPSSSSSGGNTSGRLRAPSTNVPPPGNGTKKYTSSATGVRPSSSGTSIRGSIRRT
ncbi:hypothetical protein AX17_004594 [Amanita inopinata Kibby_2008]|nr:hypothetical protein AX17_004594 [Amanita inopinata Kibby_2008]